MEALLSSIKRYWKQPDYHVTIIYNTTNASFQKGYDILQKEYPWCSFIKEVQRNQCWKSRDYFCLFNLKKMIRHPYLRLQKTDFRDKVIQTLNASEAGYVMFLTDDSAFFREVNLSREDMSFIDANPAQHQISLRLGEKLSGKPAEIRENGGKLIWKFHQHRNVGSWGYNFSVDAHIYSAGCMKRILQTVIFNNPSSLEVNVLYYARKHKILDVGMTWKEPFLLSYPLNMVQRVENNESMGISENLLNRLFLEGKRMQYIVPEEITKFQQYPESILLISDNHKDLFKIK